MKVRTTAPSESDKNYISVYNGGYNKALRIKSNGSCLPNCVGYVWGQWRELLGTSPKLTTGNAKTFYGCTSDGYSRGKTPRIGAIICWNGTYGHVGIVVEIKNEYIKVAQSNYGGTRFEVVACYKMSNGGYKSHAGNTAFQGFIYLPSGVQSKIESTTTTTNSGNETITKGKIEKYKNGKEFKCKVDLNMRSKPSTKTGKVIKTLASGSKVMYYGYYALNKTTETVLWYYVTDGTNKGYVYGGVYKSGKAPYLEGAEP